MINERQFYNVIENWRDSPYNWTANNCCHFAADIAACWGVDIDVPACETADDANEWIRSQGVRSLYHYLVKLFGKPKAPLQGKRGWIVYRKGVGLKGSAIGVIERKALFVGDNGLIEIPLSQCAAAFDPEYFRG